MLQNLLGLLTSVWQIHLAVAGLVYQNHPIEQTLTVVLIGSTTGFTLAYLSFDVLRLFWLAGCALVKWLKKLFKWKEAVKTAVRRGNHRPTFRDKAVQWMVNHKSPRIVIFCAAVIPVPGLEYTAIMAARFVKMPRGYWFLLLANAIRTILVVIGGYYFGGKI
ncbi:hypothetical protein KJ840_02765 [Patescibacteria group bacterium]|nr:hypothetical protein [Patescibacteria group bacterium]